MIKEERKDKQSKKTITQNLENKIHLFLLWFFVNFLIGKKKENMKYSLSETLFNFAIHKMGCFYIFHHFIFNFLQGSYYFLRKLRNSKLLQAKWLCKKAGFVTYINKKFENIMC
jgi:hypothetical protein